MDMQQLPQNTYYLCQVIARERALSHRCKVSAFPVGIGNGQSRGTLNPAHYRRDVYHLFKIIKNKYVLINSISIIWNICMT